MPVIVLKKVVLPAPLGPMRPAIIPFSSVKVILLTAGRPPKVLVTLRASKSAMKNLLLFLWFFFGSVQFLANLCVGQKTFRTDGHHDYKRKPKEQEAI